MNINLTSIEVKAEVRELRCSWTSTMTKDLKTHNSFDYNDELVSEITKETRIKKIDKIFS